MFTHWTY